MMTRLATAALLLAAACRAGKPGDPANPAPEPVRLCVRNENVAYGNVLAYAGQTRFDVMPGHQVCKVVRGNAMGISLRATTTSGGAHGPRYSRTRLQMNAERCWQWRLTAAPGPSGDLTPCDGASEQRAVSGA
jgi:hypothetical protein